MSFMSMLLKDLTQVYRASFRRAALLVSSLSPAETQKVLHQLAALSHDWNHSAY